MAQKKTQSAMSEQQQEQQPQPVDDREARRQQILRDIQETREAPEALAQKCAALAEAMRNAKHIVAFVGAGISVAAGARSFRGKDDGLWTQQLLESLGGSAGSADNRNTEGNPEAASAAVAAVPAAAAKKHDLGGEKGLEQLVPTFTHRFLAALTTNAVPNEAAAAAAAHVPAAPRIDFVCSQNVDALLLRSGIDPHLLFEIHGNAFVERCMLNKSCPSHKRDIIRDFDVCDDTQVFSGQCATCMSRGMKLCHCAGGLHRTRRCDVCGSILQDTLVHFGESIDAAAFEQMLAEHFTGERACDLLIALGSSLCVFPAAKLLPMVAERGGKVAIVNLQRTDMDSFAVKCGLHIQAETDTVCQMLAALLGVAVPPYDPARSKLIPTPKRTAPLSRTHCFNGEAHQWKRSEKGYPCSVCKRQSVKVWCSGAAECCSNCCGVAEEEVA